MSKHTLIKTLYGKRSSLLLLVLKNRTGKSSASAPLRLQTFLLSFLLYSLISVSMAICFGGRLAIGSCAAQGFKHPTSITYANDNGNYGSVTVSIQYYFVGSTMYYFVHDLTVGYSKKMRDLEPQLYAVVYNKRLCGDPKLINTVEARFTGEVQFGTTKLIHSDVSITGSIYGVGENKRQFTHFTPPEGADKITDEYHKKHGTNLYTDNCMIFAPSFDRLNLYDLDRAINDLRTKLKRDKQEIQRQFDAKITQASLQSNLSKFEEAMARLSEAHDLIKGNKSRQRKYDATKSEIERRRESEQQKKDLLAAREKKAELERQKNAAAQPTALRSSQRSTASTTGSPSSSQSNDQPHATSGTKPSHTPSNTQPTYTQHTQQTQAQSRAYLRTPEYRQARYEKAKAEYDKKQKAERDYQAAQQARKADLARKKAEAAQQRIKQMKRQIQENQRRAQEIDDASHTLMDGLTSSSNNPIDVLNAAKPLAMKFAQQGNAAGAYGSIGVGMLGGVLKMASANKKRKEAERAEQQRRQAIREKEEAARKKREAEAEKLRREAFRLLITSRHAVLNTFDQHDPIPLSTSTLEEDRIYYFLYALDSSTFNTANTTIYVSNVFAIERYNDGTWPYQSKITQQISELTPQIEILQGYYLDLAEAEAMREAFVNGFSNSKGIHLTEFDYRKASVAEEGADVSDTGSGRYIEGNDQNGNRSGAGGHHQTGDLGIPIGPGKASSGNSNSKPATDVRNKSDTKAASKPQKNAGTTEHAKNSKTKTGGGLGIPIK